jgi:hypothetical protein
VAVLAEHLASDVCLDRLGLEAELNDRVAALYGLTTDEEHRVVEGLPLLSAERGSEEPL